MITNRPATSRPVGHVDSTMMLAMHDAFRRDLAHAASRHRSDDPARHEAVLTGWQLFKTQLHMHHTGEDSDPWPRTRAHLAGHPDDLALLQAMQDEHGRIDRCWTPSTTRSPTATRDTSGWPTPSTPWPRSCRGI